MKTKEELNALKEEVETLNKKLHELTEEELAQVSGGIVPPSQREDLPERTAPLYVELGDDWDLETPHWEDKIDVKEEPGHYSIQYVITGEDK